MQLSAVNFRNSSSDLEFFRNYGRDSAIANFQRQFSSSGLEKIAAAIQRRKIKLQKRSRAPVFKKIAAAVRPLSNKNRCSDSASYSGFNRLAAPEHLETRLSHLSCSSRIFPCTKMLQMILSCSFPEKGSPVFLQDNLKEKSLYQNFSIVVLLLLFY